MIGLLLAGPAGAQTFVVTAGDLDGFGFGTAPGADVPQNVYDNRTGGDPLFTDNTIPDVGEPANFSFLLSFGQTFGVLNAAKLEMGLQEVESLSSTTGTHVYIDGLEVQAALSDYMINGVPLSGSTVTPFFDTVVSQGNFHTDRVTVVLPASFYSLLLDGDANISFVNGGESYAIDYVRLTVTAVPEPGAATLLLAAGALLWTAGRRQRMRRAC